VSGITSRALSGASLPIEEMRFRGGCGNPSMRLLSSLVDPPMYRRPSVNADR
jgi:hypothetical protein